mgnify:FL=1|jgi:uncharacterized protein YneF (UPF0154 family)
MYYIMIGAIIFVIGICGLIAGYIIDDDMYIVLFVWGWIGIILGILMIAVALSDKNINENMTINENSTEIETVTETQSVKTSDIKVAILNKYSGAEIISSDKPDKGYFIYEQEKYSYELDDNILFINKDNKTVDYLYVN